MTDWIPYLLAMALPPALLVGWGFVQALWRTRFSTSDEYGDVLASRGDCGRCDCATPCSRRQDL